MFYEVPDKSLISVQKRVVGQYWLGLDLFLPANTVVTKYIRDVLLHVLALALHLLSNVRHYRSSSNLPSSL